MKERRRLGSQEAREARQTPTQGELVRMAKDLARAERNRELEEIGRNLPPDSGLFNEDFRTAGQVEDGSVKLVFCDPPYLRKDLEIYADLGAFAARVLVDGGSLVCYAPHYGLLEVLAAVGEHLRPWWIFAEIQGTLDAKILRRGVYATWMPVLWFLKGSLPAGTFIRDSLRTEMPDKTYHDWTKSTEMAEHVIKHLSQPGDVICDPCCGSATTLIAARGLGRRAVGFEVDEGNYQRALARLAS